LDPRHDSQAGSERRIEIIVISLILILGFWVRIDDLADWNAQPHRAFHRGEPLLTNYDGHYYLTLARDLLNGQYARIDEKRSHPDHPLRPFPPPLLSVVAAAIAKLTNSSLNWIGVLLPAALGVLLGLPLYGLGRLWGGPVMGGTAALLGLLSSFYLYRSSLGWFDTDCMIVTLTMGGIYFFYRFGAELAKTRYLYFLGGMITSGLFLWWWDQVVHVVVLISLFPLVVAALVSYRPPAREGLLFGVILGSAFILVLIFVGWDLPHRIIESVWSLKDYLAKSSHGAFPNIVESIWELKRPPVHDIAIAACGSWPAFLAAIGGMILFAVRQPREALFLGVPISLAGFSFLYASRFQIFLAPVVAIGIGYLVAEVWKRRHRRASVKVISPLLVILAAWPLLANDFTRTSWPAVQPTMVEAMERTRLETPPDAVIWTTWSFGYMIIYWSERATVNDGQAHPGERTVYNYIPLASQSPRLAANFMQFFSKHGISGVQQVYEAVGDDPARGLALVKSILAGGPQRAQKIIRRAGLEPVGPNQEAADWLSFFFPSDAPPAYLFLHDKMPTTSRWWYWLGSWNVKTRSGTHPKSRIFQDVSVTDNRVKGSRELEVDLETGRVSHRRGTLTLKSAAVDDGRQIRKHLYESDVKNHLYVSIPFNFASIHDEDLNDSVFGRLFYRRSAPRQYFQPVMINGVSHQLWRVRGDRLEAAKPDQ
jgi:dolichyl-diphosphooligosaccharide--protein glycosyltransferase